MAEWLRRLTRKPKVREAVDSNLALDSLVAVHNSSPSRPEPCEGNLVAAAGSCGGLMVKHPWPLLEISLSDCRKLATLNINTYLPTYLPTCLPTYLPAYLTKCIKQKGWGCCNLCWKFIKNIELVLMWDILASMIILLAIIFKCELPHKRRMDKAVVFISLIFRAWISESWPKRSARNKSNCG